MFVEKLKVAGEGAEGKKDTKAQEDEEREDKTSEREKRKLAKVNRQCRGIKKREIQAEYHVRLRNDRNQWHCTNMSIRAAGGGRQNLDENKN